MTADFNSDYLLAVMTWVRESRVGPWGKDVMLRNRLMQIFGAWHARK